MKTSRWATASDSESSDEKELKKASKKKKIKTVDTRELQQVESEVVVFPEVSLDNQTGHSIKVDDFEEDEDERIEPDRGAPVIHPQDSVIIHQLTTSIFQGPIVRPCRSVDTYEKLNRIDEGSYGIVYRGRDKVSGRIVALKKLKLENEKRGFPVTALREIHTLMMCKHPHIVDILEVVLSPSKSK